MRACGWKQHDAGLKSQNPPLDGEAEPHTAHTWHVQNKTHSYQKVQTRFRFISFFRLLLSCRSMRCRLSAGGGDKNSPTGGVDVKVGRSCPLLMPPQCKGSPWKRGRLLISLARGGMFDPYRAPRCVVVLLRRLKEKKRSPRNWKGLEAVWRHVVRPRITSKTLYNRTRRFTKQKKGREVESRRCGGNSSEQGK